MAFGHVHGLGINPSDNRLYVAAHMGVFKQTDDGFERVADRGQDTMAFTVTGDDTFLASGHPDPREAGKPAHLGLIESTDAAQTWNALSLEGEADFHALEPAADRLYGYDSTDGILKVSSDHRQWRDIARLGVVDLAVDPDDPKNLLVTGDRAQVLRLSHDQKKLSVVAGSPRLAFIDWPRRDLLVGVAPDGAVYRSTDGGKSWEAANSVGAPPEALDASPQAWHARRRPRHRGAEVRIPPVAHQAGLHDELVPIDQSQLRQRQRELTPLTRSPLPDFAYSCCC